MPINEIIDLIEAEIATRKSNKFGIGFGTELYHELVKMGKIQKQAFAVLVPGFLEDQLPAYIGPKSAYAAYNDWELGDLEFKVGNPD